MVTMKAELSEREKNALLNGMSKRHAISLVFLQELGASCIDVPIPIDAYDLKKIVYENQDSIAHTVSSTNHSLVNQSPSLIRTDIHDNLNVTGNFAGNLNNNLSDSINNTLTNDSNGNTHTQSPDHQLSYKSKKAPHEIIDFYMSNMERSDWQFCHDFHAHETILSFVKPDRRCIISIRPYKTYTHVFIFISNRIF